MTVEIILLGFILCLKAVVTEMDFSYYYILYEDFFRIFMNILICNYHEFFNCFQFTCGT